LYFQNQPIVADGFPGDGRANEWRRRFAWLTGAHSTAFAVSAMVALFVLLHGAWFFRGPGDLDAFNFVLGVRDFDVAQHRPHPPGAPVYIAAGKAITWLWQRLGLPVDSLAGAEPAALRGLSLIAGAISIVLTWRILRRLDGRSARTRRATLVVASTPLVWMIAGRSLSDAAGLLLVLAACLLMARGQIHAGSALSGIGMGLRVQTTLLTIPVLLICLARTRSRKTAAAACGWFTAGTILWLLPLLVVTGGPTKYWMALANQGKDDFANPVVLAAAPTLRNIGSALFNTLVRPWGAWALAAVVLTTALVGAVRLQRTSARHATVMVICVVPYALFDLIFQETATIRYALPIVLSIAYLAAVAIESVPFRWRSAATVLLVGSNLFVSVRAVQAYSREGTPAMALLEAMHQRATVEPPAFVTGHTDVMLARIVQVLTRPSWRTVSPPELYEWRSTIEHWTRGGTAPIWFVANPRRTDLLLIDRRSEHLLGSFTLKTQATWILNGLRPKAFNWWELRSPAWIALKGFALTPEIGGLAARDRQGPAFDGAMALVRRPPSGAVLVVGGRHVGGLSDPPVRVIIEVNGHAVSTVFANAQDRRYVAAVHLRADQLAGDTPYATVTIRSTSLSAPAAVVPVTVEQFDYQPEEGVLFALAGGWHEPEQEPGTGLTWRWASRRATVRVHRRPGTTVELTLSGDVPTMSRARSAQIRVISGGRELDAFAGAPAFLRRVEVPSAPSDACDVEILIESTFSFVPYEEGESADRRELAFRAFNLDVLPLTESK
jgi:hypothetical protein